MGLVDINDADSSQQSLALRAINGAVDEIATFGPADWWGDTQHADVLKAPTTDTITITQDAKTLSNVDATSVFQPVNIDGESYTNRILVDDANAPELMIPCEAASGSTIAAVMFDTIVLPSTFRTLKGDCATFYSGGQAIAYDGPWQDLYGNRASVGQPSSFRIVSRRNTSGQMVKCMQFSSTPAGAMRFTFDFYKRPAVVANLSTSRDDLCPPDFEHSILVPIVLSKLAGLTNAIQVDRASIQANYQSASLTLVSVASPYGATRRSKIQSGFYH